MPRVSVITLTYNHGPYLDTCLKSALAQTFEDWELILVDDGSADESWEIAQSYAAQDARIKAFHQENQGYFGLAATHNFALSKASGDLVAILDGDDYWPADKLEQQVALHGPETLMSYGRYLLKTETETLPGTTPPFSGRIDSLTFLRHLLLHRSHMINVTLIMSRKALDAIGGFIQAGPRTEMPTGLALSQLDGEIVYLPKVLGYWRQHRQQHTRNSGSGLAEYNLMLSIRTLLDQPTSTREQLGISVADIVEARKAMIADTYFTQVRSALLQRDHVVLPGAIRQLWYWGGTKRKLQALYAMAAARLNFTYEPMLRAYEALAAALRPRQP